MNNALIQGFLEKVLEKESSGASGLKEEVVLMPHQENAIAKTLDSKIEKLHRGMGGIL